MGLKGQGEKDELQRKAHRDSFPSWFCMSGVRLFSESTQMRLRWRADFHLLFHEGPLRQCMSSKARPFQTERTRKTWVALLDSSWGSKADTLEQGSPTETHLRGGRSARRTGDRSVSRETHRAGNLAQLRRKPPLWSPEAGDWASE